MNQHPEPLWHSIALQVVQLRGREWAGSAPDRGQARAGGLLSTAGALYYQLYRLKKSPPAAPKGADGPVKVQCPLAGSNRRPEH